MTKKPGVTNTTREVGCNPGLPSLVRASLMGPRAIEDMEAAGQAELVKADVLPTDIRPDKATGAGRAALKAAGVKVLGPVEGDEIFQHVELPQGWTKRATEHAMWSTLHDERGRERARIFYKAAFYDRSAYIGLITRFVVVCDYDAKHLAYSVRDSGREIQRFEDTSHIQPSGGATEDKEAFWKRERELRKEADAWLAARYPNHHDVAAYWDEP
jgi:hypothetical protein